jgi:hypothetical protein
MKLLVVVPGFGEPKLEFKSRLLRSNLERVRDTFSGAVDVKLFNYGRDAANIAVDGVAVEEVVGPGIIGQFLYRHVRPQVVSGYDYVIVMLDDIELSASVNIDRMILNYEKYAFDILSPSLTRDSVYSHQYMLQREDSVKRIRITQCLEMFLYLMRPTSYTKWFNLLDERSVWLWGIDYALYNYGIKTGLMDTMTVKHHIKGASHSADLPVPMEELNYNRGRLRLQAQVRDYEYVDMI